MMIRNLSKPPSLGEGRISNWQTIIWREWCRAKDEDYAFYLYDLVRTSSFGLKFVVAIALASALGGVLMGYLFGSILPADLSINIDVGGFNIAWDLTSLRAILIWLMGLAGGLFGIEASRKYRSWYFWWQGQPAASKVEWALQQAKALRSGAEEVWTEPLNRLEKQKKQQSQPDQLIMALASEDWIDRFTARQALATLGGEATSALKELADDRSNPLWQVGMWLLTGIEQETTNRFAWRVGQTYCPRCLARFDACQVDMIWGIDFSFYGCRICHQSREFRLFPKGVAAVLDSSESEEQVEQDGLLQINWLKRRTLFDFEWVEIVQASDEDVERFAVQIGNDTDPFRRSRYQQMRCLIGPDCRLSENTLRILDRMFGGVEHTNQLPSQQRAVELRWPSHLSDDANGGSGRETPPQSEPKLRKLTRNE